MKKFSLFVLGAIIIAFGVVYYFRYDIFQYSADSIFRKNLPSYIKVGEFVFDVENSLLKISDFTVKNPRGYGNKYFAEIDEITCKYKQKGKNILNGIEVTDINIDGPVINIERRSNGDININHMDTVMTAGNSAETVHTETVSVKETDKESFVKKLLPKKKFKISELIKLPDEIKISNGKLVFEDKHVPREVFKVFLAGINGNLSLTLSEDFDAVQALATKGRGHVNNDRRQLVDWEVFWDPTKKDLLMSNRFDLNNVDITHFKIYYDDYLPVDISSCECSGVLIFNFNDGQIGSQNRLLLSNLQFKEKPGEEGKKYWDISVSDIVKYLQSSSGEIIFDFKIKGSLERPKFYPGDHVKKAIISMGFDKISGKLSDMFQGNKSPEGGAAGAVQGSETVSSGGGESNQSGGKTDAELVFDAIKDLF